MINDPVIFTLVGFAMKFAFAILTAITIIITSVVPVLAQNSKIQENTLIAQVSKQIPKVSADEGPHYITAWDSRLNSVKPSRDGIIIWVNISRQRVSVFKNKKFVTSYQVVTGKNSTPTPLGTFKITNNKEYDPDGNVELNGSYGTAYVHTWNPFSAGNGNEYAFHDADGWRSYDEYGNTSVYPYDGSHGCVNMHAGDARQLYNTTNVGTVVHITKN